MNPRPFSKIAVNPATGLLVAAFMLTGWQLAAQSRFQHAYGEAAAEQGYKGIQTAGGEYVFVGRSASVGAGNDDVLLFKTDAIGITQWVAYFGGANADGAFGVKETPDGGFVITGYTWSYGSGAQDALLLKTDNNGTLLWAYAYGDVQNDIFYDVILTSGGGFAVAGWTYSYGAGSSDVFVLKTDADGVMEWSSVVGTSRIQVAYSLAETPDGGYVVSGYTGTAGPSGQDLYLLKLDVNGTLEWSNNYGDNSQETGTFVLSTTDGGYIVAGSIQGQGVSPSEVLLLKTDSGGNPEWSNTYGDGTATRDAGTFIQQTADNGYVIAGVTAGFGAGQNDAYVIKTDNSGAELWAGVFGGGMNEYAGSVLETADAGYIVTGYTSGYGAGNDDWFVVKTGDDGSCGCNESSISSVVAGFTMTAGGLAVSVASASAGTSVFPSGGYDSFLMDTLCNSSLPVELVYFNGKMTDEGAGLSWGTASELNNDFFEIQRSSDGETFDIAGKVEGMGDAPAGAEYAFLDAGVEQGINYYRLRQVDYDGHERYSEIITVNNDKPVTGLSVLGNPAAGSALLVQLPALDREMTLELHDASGRVLYRNVFERNVTNTTLEVPAGLLPGMYVLTARAGDDLYREKVMVQ